MSGQPGGAKVTLAQIAETVGVSVATVSNAYNGTGRVSAPLRRRILDVADDLGFTGSNPVARGLRRGRVGAVGWILTESLSYAVENEATLMFLRGMNETLEAATVGLLVVSSPSVSSPSTTIVRDAIVDGFIAYSLADDDPMLAAARARGVRIVVVEQPIVEGVPSVLVDSRGGCRTAAEHLLELGHRRFGVLSLRTARTSVEGPVSADALAVIRYDMTRQRLGGYRDALTTAGVPVAELPVYEAASTVESAKVGASWLLARNPRPTAILAMSDTLAAGAVEAARELGLSVPHDLSIVGFDDAPAAAGASPPLTTVRQPLREKGTRSARLLLNGGTDSVTLPTDLIVRGSTAKAPASR